MLELVPHGIPCPPQGGTANEPNHTTALRHLLHLDFKELLQRLYLRHHRRLYLGLQGLDRRVDRLEGVPAAARIFGFPPLGLALFCQLFFLPRGGRRGGAAGEDDHQQIQRAAWRCSTALCSKHCGHCRRKSIGTSCRQRVPTTLTGSLRHPPVCLRRKMHWSMLRCSLAFLVSVVDLGAVVVRCPQHGAVHSVQWVRRAVQHSTAQFVALLHDTVASLSLLSDRNVLYIRIRDTLISHKRSDIYISSAPLQ